MPYWIAVSVKHHFYHHEKKVAVWTKRIFRSLLDNKVIVRHRGVQDVEIDSKPLRILEGAVFQNSWSCMIVLLLTPFLFTDKEIRCKWSGTLCQVYISERVVFVGLARDALLTAGEGNSMAPLLFMIVCWLRNWLKLLPVRGGSHFPKVRKMRKDLLRKWGKVTFPKKGAESKVSKLAVVGDKRAGRCWLFVVTRRRPEEEKRFVFRSVVEHRQSVMAFGTFISTFTDLSASLKPWKCKTIC